MTDNTSQTSWIQCPKCTQAQFQAWVFDGQKFPFKSCKDCRMKAKQNSQFNKIPISEDENFALLMNANRELYKKLDEVHSDLIAKYTDMQITLQDIVDRISKLSN